MSREITLGDGLLPILTNAPEGKQLCGECGWVDESNFPGKTSKTCWPCVRRKHLTTNKGKKPCPVCHTLRNEKKFRHGMCNACSGKQIATLKREMAARRREERALIAAERARRLAERTARRVQVKALVAEGLDAKAIAKKLDVALSIVLNDLKDKTVHDASIPQSESRRNFSGFNNHINGMFVDDPTNAAKRESWAKMRSYATVSAQ